MKIRWCAFTGALMLCFVLVTFWHRAVIQDLPGVKTRWWDGTTQSIEQLYENGKPQSFTQFGDDGKTVLLLREWTPAGVLVHEKLRLPEGTLEERMFSNDGKIVVLYRLWNGDEVTFRIKRRYFDDGKLSQEEIRTDDGMTTKHRRTFTYDGSLAEEFRVLDNADQQTDNYYDGKLNSTSIWKANSDQINISYYRENGLPSGLIESRQTIVAMNHSELTEQFAKDGQLIWSQFRDGDHPGVATISSFVTGKLRYEQSFTKWNLESVKEFSPQTGLVVRELFLDPLGAVLKVALYRADGTLARLKHMAGRRVTKQLDYDASGKAVVAEQDGGEPESIERKLLSPLSRF